MSKEMRSIVPGEIPTRDLHQFLLGSVAPRPIAFVSTMDAEGRPNLAPFSFFNIFSSNPPIAVFSSNRRVVDNTTKDTLHNVRETGEAVINVVSHDIVRQMAICSVQFEAGISEFEKSNLTPLASELVAPFRVAESPAQMECKVVDIITLGEHGGAGHLIICDIVRLHIAERVIGENGRIDPYKIDLMGRMGRAYYCRAHGDAIKTIVQPVTEPVISYSALPEHIKQSEVLTANEIARLSGLHEIPDEKKIKEVLESEENTHAILHDSVEKDFLHKLISDFLSEERLEVAAALAFSVV